MTEEQRNQVKQQNIQTISDMGYRYIDWLPILEEPNCRSLEAIKGRMAVMNALINISFEAPTFIIKEWIEHNNLSEHLSAWEKDVLQKQNEQLTQIEKNSLRWYLEGLWALMWATKMIDDLDETIWCSDEMASVLPNLEKGEDNQKLEEVNEVRSVNDLYETLDYYYRLHWYCVDERINGKQAKINEGIVYERRKALEWIMNAEADWDNVEMST